MKTFEECTPIIDRELLKRKLKWTLSSIAWMDYEDVSQIIRIHIYRKWDKYDQTKPLVPWISMIISNQMKNIIKSVYSNYSRPCIKCDASKDLSDCSVYGEQCTACPLYHKWVKRKQTASQIKNPLAMENHVDEVYNIPDQNYDVILHSKLLHQRMQQILKPMEWKIYQGLFIYGLNEKTVARSVGYISNEKGRCPGYKQIRNVRRTIIEIARHVIRNEDIFA